MKQLIFIWHTYFFSERSYFKRLIYISIWLKKNLNLLLVVLCKAFKRRKWFTSPIESNEIYLLFQIQIKQNKYRISLFNSKATFHHNCLIAQWISNCKSSTWTWNLIIFFHIEWKEEGPTVELPHFQVYTPDEYLW